MAFIKKLHVKCTGNSGVALNKREAQEPPLHLLQIIYICAFIHRERSFSPHRPREFPGRNTHGSPGQKDERPHPHNPSGSI